MVVTEEEGAGGGDEAGASCVEVREFEGRGRGLVARWPLAAGATVAVHEPLLAVPSHAWRHHTCAYCFSTDDRRRWPHRCPGGCAVLRYCSEACLQADQQEGGGLHSAAACRALRSLCSSSSSGMAPCPTTMLVTSLLASSVTLPLSTWEAVWGLCHLTHDRLDDELRQEMEQIVERVVAVLPPHHPPPPAPPILLAPTSEPSALGRACWEVLLRLECNVFSYWGLQGLGYDEQRGLGVFHRAALFNHSCTPNTAKVLCGRRLVMVALQPVASGEELCLSYLPSTMTRQERARTLHRHFHFQCTCPRCSSAQEEGEEEEGAEGAHGSCGGYWLPPDPIGGGERGKRRCSLCGEEEAA